MGKATATLALLLALPLVASALEQPTRDEIQRVLGYYYESQGAPVLVEAKFCTGVHRQGAMKNTCEEEIPPTALVNQEEVYLWMNFMVPAGEKPTILVQMNHKGLTRDTHSFTVESAVRYRTWKKIRFSRAGEWVVPVYHETLDGVAQLSEIKVIVN